MASYCETGIIQTKTARGTALEVVCESLSTLVADFAFDFTPFGGLLRLVFEDQKYKGEARIEAKVPVREITPERLDRLWKSTEGLSLVGSMAIPGMDRRFDCEVALYPSFDESAPACVVFRLDSWFIDEVWGRDLETFSEDGAGRLFELSVSLGANPKIDGFRTVRLPSFAQVDVVDASYLKHALLDPSSVAERGGGFRPGLVTGVKSAFATVPEVTIKWSGAVVKQTITGFTVISLLINDDDDDE